jgi:hypothetical protein
MALVSNAFGGLDPTDAFLDKALRITATELYALLDAKLVAPEPTAVRFYALSLALNRPPTDKKLYDALVEFDFHPELVSVAGQMGKGYVVETANLIKKLPVDKALYAASAAGKIQVMKLLFELGATRYSLALLVAAREGKLEAMELLQTMGARRFDRALEIAAEADQLDAMRLIKKWGGSSFNSAFKIAARKNRITAMTCLKDWGANKFEKALFHAAEDGSLDAMKLVRYWGAKEFDQALAHAASGGQLEAMKLLKDWGATDFDRALVWTMWARNKAAPIALLEEWISARG